MRTEIRTNAIWQMIPSQFSAKIADPIQRANLCSNAIFRCYKDLSECFHERVRIPLREGAFQIVENKTEWIDIKEIRYDGRNYPLEINGDYLEIPIQYDGENINDEEVFEIRLTVVPQVMIGVDNDKEYYYFNIDKRIKQALQYSLMIECYTLEDDPEQIRNIGSWEMRYTQEIKRLRNALKGAINVSQIFTANEKGTPFFE
jgi:hypothetical protein